MPRHCPLTRKTRQVSSESQSLESAQKPQACGLRFLCKNIRLFEGRRFSYSLCVVFVREIALIVTLLLERHRLDFATTRIFDLERDIRGLVRIDKPVESHRKPIIKTAGSKLVVEVNRFILNGI